MTPINFKKLPKIKQNYVVEQNQRLSDSIIWDWQKVFFNEQGIDAWRRNIVPYYMTNNAFIADRYAKIVFGYLCDELLSQQINEPIYIIELGAGCGAFAYRFMKHFFTLLTNSHLSHLQVTYVITDLVQANIDFCRTHAKLQPYIKSGHCDFAVFDAAFDQQLKLLGSGKILAQGKVSSPLVVIANYVFDCLPHDLFYYKEQQCYQMLTAVSLRLENKLPEDVSKLIALSQLSYQRRLIRFPYYESKAWDSLLQTYLDKITDSFLLLSTAALSCFDNLSVLSNQRLLILTADKGFFGLDQLHQPIEPRSTIFGAFSFSVNYHALAEYIRQQNGLVFQSKYFDDNLAVNAFVISHPNKQYLTLRQSFKDSIIDFGPNDFFHIKRLLVENIDYLTLTELFVFLRLSQYDSKVLWHILPRLTAELPESDKVTQTQWRAAIDRAWSNHYSVGDSCSLAFDLGVLMIEMEDWQAAINYYNYALQDGKNAAKIYFNKASCYQQLGLIELARQSVHEALTVKPDFAEAKKFMLELER